MSSKKPDLDMPAFAIYTWNDGRRWTVQDGIGIRLGQELQEVADAAYELQKDSMSPARLVSVEVIYKGRRAKRVA